MNQTPIFHCYIKRLSVGSLTKSGSSMAGTASRICDK